MFSTFGPFSDDQDGKRATRSARLHSAPHQWGAFKTPSLRNVTLTAPYMHQGQFATLRDVLQHYSTFEGAAPPGREPDQLLIPVGLSETEMEDLLAFLATLAGTPPAAELLAPPAAAQVQQDS